MDAAPGPADESAFVDIVRDFLAAHAALRRVAALHRAGRLRFEEVKELVGDGEEAVLFRLKERCHELFRREGEGADVGREALLDLAVGALFHECMKLRESFYQHAVYGPKVRALRAAAGPARDELFREFEKILAQSSVRLAEALHEAEILLHQTSVELEALLRSRAESGLLARLLVERGEDVAAALGRPAAELVTAVFGSEAAALERAARSYLASGYFAEAARSFERTARGGAPEIAALRHFALGMQAFLERDYEGAVAGLRRWWEGGAPHEPRLAEQAWVALARVGPLLDEASRSAALELTERLRPIAGRVRQGDGARA
jgi:hypothetical protein